jgi:hypothetical protein
LDAIAEKAGVEPDINMMNRKLKRLNTEIANAVDAGISVDDKRATYEKHQVPIDSYKVILDEAAAY